MRKAYVKPNSRVHECECAELCSHSGHHHHDHGHHHGWDNPHNPHHPGNGESEGEG